MGGGGEIKRPWTWGLGDPNPNPKKSLPPSPDCLGRRAGIQLSLFQSLVSPPLRFQEQERLEKGRARVR